MLKGEWFARVVRGVVARPLLVLVVAGAVALVGAGLALRIEPSASTDTLVDESSDAFKATEEYKQRFGDDAVVGLLGGTPAEIPDVYRLACPLRLLPLGVPQVAVHGTRDTSVPLDLTTLYPAAAGPECVPLILPDADHFDVIDPASAAWAGVVNFLPSP